MKLFLFLTALAFCQAFTVTPFAKKWTIVGQTTTLQCKSSDAIHGCTWTTPYGKTFTLTKGLKTEQGRIEYFDNGDDTYCGLTINNVEGKDQGNWTCQVGVVKNSEVNYAREMGSLNIATKPESISLDKPFDQGTANVSDEWDQKPVKCIVRNAYPEPEFHWFVGDEKLTGYEIINDVEQDEKSWIQTLKYSPALRHANQTLRCVVDHVGLDSDDSREAGVVLRFTEVSEEYLKEIQEQDHSKENAFTHNMALVIGSVSALSILILIVLITFKLKSKRQGKEKAEDVESAQDKNEPEKEEEGEASEPKETLDESAKPKITLKERFSSFFSFNKKQPANETLNETEKANDEFEKVDLEDKEEPEKKEEVTETEEKEKSDPEKDEDVQDDAKDEEAKKSSKIRTFFKFLNFKQTPKVTEEITLKANGDSNETSTLEEKAEAQDENKKESDEKSEALPKEEEKTEGVKNTDV